MPVIAVAAQAKSRSSPVAGFLHTSRVYLGLPPQFARPPGPQADSAGEFVDPPSLRLPTSALARRPHARH